MKTLPFFYEDIGKILRTARQRKFTTAQSEMIQVYWKIGKRIVEKEQGGARAEYGALLTKEFSKELSLKFGTLRPASII
jgi:hypothetical protein